MAGLVGLRESCCPPPDRLPPTNLRNGGPKVGAKIDPPKNAGLGSQTMPKTAVPYYLLESTIFVKHTVAAKTFGWKIKIAKWAYLKRPGFCFEKSLKSIDGIWTIFKVCNKLI